MKVKNFNVQIDHEPDPVYLGRDLFEPRDDLKGWRSLLQRFCFWSLRKLGSVMGAPPTRVVRHMTPIDDREGDIARIIQGQIENFYIDVWMGRAKTLLVGRDFYHEIMRGPGMTEGWVALDYAVKVGRSGYGTQVFGLDLHVIDRMEGFLVLPGRITSDGRYTEEERESAGLARGIPYVPELNGPTPRYPFS